MQKNKINSMDSVKNESNENDLKNGMGLKQETPINQEQKEKAGETEKTVGSDLGLGVSIGIDVEESKKGVVDFYESLGAKRVHLKFNPSENPIVKEIKTRSAELINLVEELRNGGGEETQRLVSMAQTEVELACMLMVKANFAD